ncbi:MAG: hypothetical protein RIR49_1209 [Actinomycetota bacterium]
MDGEPGDVTLPPRRRTVDRRPAPLVALVALVSAWPHWWPGRVVVSFDGAMYSGPNTRVTAEALLSGRIPFINPSIFGGAPHLGNHHTGVLSPPRWLVLGFEPLTANGLLVTGHLVLLGVTMVWLARRLGVGPVGSAVAGVVAVMSGAVSATSVQFEQILVLAWAPALLWAIVGVTEPGAPRHRTVTLAAVIALTVVSGHPQMVLEVGVLAALFTVGLLATGERRPAWRRVATGALLGAGMTAAQLAATVAATSGGALERGRSVEELSGGWFVLRARSAATATFGTILGRPPDAFSGSFESILWVGVVAVVLAIVGLVVGLGAQRQRAWVGALACVAVLSALLALGPRTPLWRLTAEWLPGFSSVRVSARWLDVVALVVALLAGLGADAVSGMRSRFAVGVAGVVTLAIITAVAIGPLESGGSDVVVVWVVTAAVALTAMVVVPRPQRSGVLLALVVIELSLMARGAIPYRLVQDHPPTADGSSVVRELADRAAAGGGWAIALTSEAGDHDDLVAGLRPNANTWFDIPSIDGYDGGVQVTDRWSDALRRFTPDPPLDLPMRNVITPPVPAGHLGRLGVRWVLLSADRDPGEWVPDLIGPVAVDDRFSLWENPRWLGDAVVWSTWTVTGDIPADLLRERFALLGETAVVGTKVDGGGDRCVVECAPRRVGLERRSPEHLVVRADVERPSVISVAAQAIDGWSVTVDGREAEVVVVDGLLLGVAVGEGSHVIEFRHRPWWWWPSVAVSLLSTAVVIGLAVGDRRASRRRTAPA